MKKTPRIRQNTLIIACTFIFFLLQICTNSFAQQAKIDSLLKVLSPKQDTVRADQLLKIARIYLDMGDTTQTQKSALASISLSNKLNWSIGKINGYQTLSLNAYNSSQLIRANEWIQKGLEQCKGKAYAVQRIIFLNQLAKNQVLMGNTNVGGYLNEVIRIAETEIKKHPANEVSIAYELLRTYNLLSYIHGTSAMISTKINVSEYDIAYNYSLKTLKLCLKYHQNERINKEMAGVYHNIAYYFHEAKQRSDSALYYFDKEIELAKKMKYKKALFEGYYGKADVLFTGGHHKEAEKWLLKAKELETEIQEPNLVASIPSFLGEIYMETGRLTEAEALLVPAFRSAEENQLSEKLQRLAILLHNLYRKKQNYQKALFFYEKVVAFKDSLYTHEKNQAINELSTKYKTEEKEQQIKVLEAEKMFRNYIILIALLALAGGVYIVRSQRKATLLEKQLSEQKVFSQEQEIEKQQIEIDAKNRELGLHSLYLNQRKNILEGIKQQLTGKNPEILDQKTLLKEIDATMQLEGEWQNFRIHFEEIYPQFFKTLLEHTPTLTELELRHCAYVKLGFSPKQVAQILNIEADSVSIARVRLKKKLKLPDEETLQNFLKNGQY